MALHLKKLCVGTESIDDLRTSIERRADGVHEMTGEPFIFITTRNRPKREAEIIGQGGALYWVIARTLCVRQRIITFRPGTRADGSNCIHIDLDHKLTLVHPRPHRPFQGWRYLEGKDAPADLTKPLDETDDDMPLAMSRELGRLGLL